MIELVCKGCRLVWGEDRAPDDDSPIGPHVFLCPRCGRVGTIRKGLLVREDADADVREQVIGDIARERVIREVLEALRRPDVSQGEHAFSYAQAAAFIEAEHREGRL